MPGARTGNFPPKLGQKWPKFSARAKGARGIPQSAYNRLQIGSNFALKRLKTQQLLQKCPWWRKNVLIASNTLKTTLKYVKTALRAPKARAKNFAQNLAPPSRIFVWGGAAPPSLARPLHETVEGLPNNSQLLVGWRTFARFILGSLLHRIHFVRNVAFLFLARSVFSCLRH